MKLAFTIVTNSYLPQALTLRKSLLTYNPEYKFVIGLLDNVDAVKDYLSRYGDFEVIELHKIGLDSFDEMLTRYTAFEMSCALKPFVAKYLLNKYQPIVLAYFDSDILIFNSLNEISQIENTAMLITPHCCEPVNRKDNHEMDLKLLNYGLYNAGFFVCYFGHSQTIEILDWWADKMKTECTTDLYNGRFVDQIWMNLMPIYFSGVKNFNHLGYNVALWNLSEREIYVKNDEFIINNNSEIKMVFFHYSGYNVLTPEIPSKNHFNFNFHTKKELKTVYDKYYSRLVEFNATTFVSYTNYYKSTIIEVKRVENGLHKVGILKKVLSYWR